MELKNLYPVVITLILIGLLLGIGIFILSSIENTVDETTSATATQEVLTQAELIAGTELDGSAYRDGSCGTVSIQNGTSGATLTAGNYTQTDCLIVNTTSDYVDSSWYVNYTITYSADTQASTAINQTIGGIGDFADWIPIIVVVIAAAIVLGIVLSSFGRQPGV
ncbi:MAG: hypothetical protein EHM47_00965 [Ignavibacteriales bacterium]|nr:MAG: hypothetical protein EHM47_00965 [Ignavibacteriales bacterium]